MDMILLFWLLGEPVMQMGPISGGPEACAALEAQILSQIAAADPQELIPLGDRAVPVVELSVTCELPPAESCPIPDDLPDFLI